MKISTEEQATGCFGADGYREYAKKKGYKYIDVWNWSSSIRRSIIMPKIKFYKEPTGDYCCVFWPKIAGFPYFEGRAVVITNLPTSVATTGISQIFLRKCKKYQEKMYQKSG